MNNINIFAPRWRDRVVLIADWKIGNDNLIEITCKKKDGSRYYPEPFRKSGQWLKKFPTEVVTGYTMRKVPLDELINP